MSSSRKISVSELGDHSKDNDAWIVINNDIWDVTEFAPEHPGGLQIVQEYFGQDATKAYNEVHGPSLVHKSLDKSKLMGKLDQSTVTDEWKSKQVSNIEEQKPIENEGRPPLEAILNMNDFQKAAQRKLSAKSYAFYSGAANDDLSLKDSLEFYRRIWFRPRVLTGVKNVNTSTTVLGQKFSIPFFSAPAALAKLSHPDGELAMARALVSKGSTIIACNNASYSLSEIMGVLPEGYPCFYQLYVNKDRAKTEALMKDGKR